MIREANANDLFNLLELYSQLNDNEVPEPCDALSALWKKIVDDKNYHIIICEEDGVILSSCTAIIVPNLTHQHRPYALVENVVTDGRHRGRGLASQCLEYAKDIAVSEKCYKIMLLTGSKKEETLRFYERAGYNSIDKTAFILWL